MNPKDANILGEVYSKMLEIEDLIKENDLSSRVLSVMMLGIIDEKDEYCQDEMVEMKSVFNFNIESVEELESIIEALREMYEGPDDLDDLLSGLGLSLN
jgi:DNA-directed RNA polymerase alpha subunit